MIFRELEKHEAPVLKDFLYEAIFIPEGVKPPEKSIVERPELKLYYEDFGSSTGDLCIVADDNGKIINTCLPFCCLINGSACH